MHIFHHVKFAEVPQQYGSLQTISRPEYLLPMCNPGNHSQCFHAQPLLPKTVPLRKKNRFSSRKPEFVLRHFDCGVDSNDDDDDADIPFSIHTSSGFPADRPRTSSFLRLDGRPVRLLAFLRVIIGLGTRAGTNNSCLSMHSIFWYYT